MLWTKLTGCLSAKLRNRDGSVLATPGEAVLSRFSDVSSCVSCAQATRDVIEDMNANAPEPERVHYRYGIDVSTLDSNQKGDCAAEIARTAVRCAGSPPNEICASEAVRQLLVDDDRFTRASFASDTGLFARTKSEQEKSATGPVQLQALELPLPERPSITLLPFTSVGQDPNADAFADGLRTDIQNALVKLSGLFLIAAGAANALRGNDVIEAARSLGVRYVLEGSCRRSGDRVRVNIQLTDTVEGMVVWAEQYDSHADDEFALQDEIAERVITALDVKLANGEQARILRKCLSNSRARDLFYRGVHEFFQMRVSQRVDPHSGRCIEKQLS